MAMVDVDGSNVLVDSQAKSVGLVWEMAAVALGVHSSNEPCELPQCSLHDHSTINIVISITIIRPPRSTTYIDDRCDMLLPTE